MLTASRAPRPPKAYPGRQAAPMPRRPHRRKHPERKRPCCKRRSKTKRPRKTVPQAPADGGKGLSHLNRTFLLYEHRTP